MHEKVDTRPCERAEEAECFLAEDADNMVTWQMCFTTYAACEDHRAHMERTEPPFMKYMPCTTRR
ncbi:hypothetical protein [Haliangium sp.]|uniref:hypothetical protein n=1 Tax=Haliangium sp. TaxID=2663208 RepID=UPI003D0FEC8E